MYTYAEFTKGFTKRSKIMSQVVFLFFFTMHMNKIKLRKLGKWGVGREGQLYERGGGERNSA